MKQYGDITKLKGAELDPVDLIVGGSPCQDLSVAGLRKGLKHSELGDEETTRSGLFMEMVRLIKEMREETNGLYPRFALWENVVGSYSSNDGRDFSAVLTEFVRIAEPGAPDVPVPEEGWPKSGVLLGADWSLGWRTHDAQFWGVPQRRRRISLIVDFRGQSASEILFEFKSMSGNFESSRETWEGAAGETEASTGTTGETVGADLYNGMITGDKAVSLTANSGQSANHAGPSVIAYNDKHTCLNPWDYQLQRIQPEDGIADALCAAEKRCRADSLVLDEGVYAVNENGDADVSLNKDVHPSLTTGGGKPGQSYPCVLTFQERMGKPGGGKGILIQEDHAGTIGTANHQMVLDENNNPSLIVEGKDDAMIVLNDHGGEQMDISIDKTGTIMAQMGGHQPLVMHEPTTIFGDDVTPTMTRSCDTAIGNTQDGLLVCQVVEDHSTYSMDAYDKWKENNVGATLRAQGGMYDGGSENIVVSNETTYQDKTGSLMASGYGKLGTQEAMNDMYVANERPVVRRLTPLECERLQGFPDEWTNIPGASDSARYKALGNSIALPFWAHLAKRCVQYGDVKTIGSLFDGIAGFPLVFKRAGAKTLWTSEIEPFCQKVVEYHMKELE